MPAGAASSAAHSGGPGIMPAGITTGVRGASLEVGGETFPRSLARIAPRDYTPLGQSRGGTPAGERARKRRAAQAALSVARPARRLRAGTDDSATAGVPLSFYLPEASRKELLRNILEWPALDWMAWVFSPIPVTASGGRKTNRLFDNTRAPSRRENGIARIRPHESGGGGPSVARAASEGWWRGRLRWSFVVDAGKSSRTAPLLWRS